MSHDNIAFRVTADTEVIFLGFDPNRPEEPAKPMIRTGKLVCQDDAGFVVIEHDGKRIAIPKDRVIEITQNVGEHRGR